MAQPVPDAFPSRNITLVIPFAAGGPADVVARIIAPGMSTALGKPIVVENRPGAGTTLANTSVARATPDGYTLLGIDLSYVVTPHLFTSINYDPIKDFAPVGVSARSTIALGVTATLPAKTVQELVQLAKAKPDELKFGTSGVGSPPYLGALAFMEATGVKMLHVPYRGAQLALTDVIGGHISLIFTAPGLIAAQASSGKVRPLGVTGKQRSPVLPDIATFKENGIEMPVFDDGLWLGIMAPAATPPPVISALNAALKAAVADSDTRTKLVPTDFVPVGSTPAELGDLVKSQLAYWRRALQAAGVKPEAANNK